MAPTCQCTGPPTIKYFVLPLPCYAKHLPRDVYTSQVFGGGDPNFGNGLVSRQWRFAIARGKTHGEIIRAAFSRARVSKTIADLYVLWGESSVCARVCVCKWHRRKNTGQPFRDETRRREARQGDVCPGVLRVFGKLLLIFYYIKLQLILEKELQKAVYSSLFSKLDRKSFKKFFRVEFLGDLRGSSDLES